MPQITWDLSAIKRDSADDPSRHVVIVKFPHIVFRWYSRQEKVTKGGMRLIHQVLRRIQFKLHHRREFSTLTSFCVEHFGAVKDLYDSSGGSSSNGGSGISISSNDDKASSVALIPGSSPLARTRTALSQTFSSPGTPSNWIQKTPQPRSVTKMLADVSSKANQMNPPIKKQEVAKASTGSQTEEILGRISGGLVEVGFHVTEAIMLSLIHDDSFMAEVVRLCRLFK